MDGWSTVLSDQIANLGVNPWPANPGGSGLPSPVEPETLPMPTDDRVGLDNDENRPPSLPQSGKPDPEYAVALAQSGTLDYLLQDYQLLAERKILGRQGSWVRRRLDAADRGPSGER